MQSPSTLIVHGRPSSLPRSIARLPLWHRLNNLAAIVSLRGWLWPTPTRQSRTHAKQAEGLPSDPTAAPFRRVAVRECVVQADLRREPGCGDSEFALSNPQI